MNSASAVRALAALAQPARLAAFRRLVQAGEAGVAAGELAAALGLSPPSLSFHLRSLSEAGLVRSRQEGRFVYYSAEYGAMDGLLAFLTESCCQGADCAPARRARRAGGVAPYRRRARPRSPRRSL
jgi:DNA-binding transcriptional ArsR family regulator